ncbi:MAG: serine/threonine protein kinase [Gemmatimonadetes bacterium]|nr:serine/threonine protein kinase [Gemmatimonadota bacterium]MBT6147050.1 serine/threonine protein kinase [Gemmatimonadota bacterium]MBT7862811.1 serine/threonine protein kinase [Gemmatimonadota bacterium]
MSNILFTSQGHTARIHADGSHLHYLALDIPDQETWQPCGTFSDGRLLLLSMEARRDGPGRPFAEFYHKTPTHVWAYDPDRDALEELVSQPRLSTFQTPQLLLNDERMLIQVVGDEGGQVYNTDLTGADAHAVTLIGEGLPYGYSLSPDGKRLACHLASPSGYQIWTSDLFGKDRTLVAAHDEYLYFAPQWSPDGQWLAYQACRYQQDPGHDGADLCVSRPDGSEQRLLTTEQSLWFAATYGPADRHGGGSNMPLWSPDGALLASCFLPESRVPWQYQPERPDVDHFNRDFMPEQARGGAQIRRFDLGTDSSDALTPAAEGIWDFRQSMSPDGAQLLFCRAPTGDSPTIWVADAGGQNARPLAKGRDELGADHPRWIP